ncbi:HERV-H LTR-associating protein 1 [Pteronotus mesoamericanus]|uniref:HERV-H LTR-associating protein 1 n=1 Tax=Pteronotus mesoamericanus TaxID=1884717 RepID=UPI0023EDF894|nr:HERV-H LTR-associating protein 1 [Pteronotus parnellii mesoamericanus]
MLGFLAHGAPGRLCVGLACVLSLWNTVSAIKGEAKKENGMSFLPSTVSGNEVKKEKAGAVLGATELPAWSVDLSALNLTQVVNGMLSRVLKDSKKFFSLLSITSYSSFAFHKFSVAIYNISHLKAVDPAMFPTRHCYCVNNRTNDLSDFTALLVDFTGNSTSYLTEIFKSTSILSVSQTDESDCIFICVMTGKSGRNLSDFWEVVEESPVINYTFTSSLSGVLGAATRETAVASKLTPTSQQTVPMTSPLHTARSTSRSALGTSPSTETTHPSEGERTVNTDRLPELLAKAKATVTLGSVSPTLPVTSPAEAQGTEWTKQTGASGGLPEPPARTQGSPPRSSPASGTFTPGTQTSSPTKAPAPRYPQTGDLSWPFIPGEEPALLPGPHQVQVSRCPRQLLREGAITAAPVNPAIQKLHPCLMELCRFFQQCLCVSQRRDPRVQAVRYCLEYYSWFLRNATYICRKAKRVSHSHTLKQKCLENICKSV